MYTTNLRKVGGSVMLAVPPVILDILHLQSGSIVNMAIEEGKLLIEPKPRIRYSLEELLAQCDESIEIDEQDKQWANSQAIGGELL